MSDNSNKAAIEIFTIGHSNHPLDKFLEILHQHRIDVVVDVRTSPYAKYATHFDQRELKESLTDAGIKYAYMGRVLGGRPASPAFYNEQGRVLYGKIAATPGFAEGIERLAQNASKYRVTIMCGEEDPTECHRRLLIGRVLGERGASVVHIRGDGRLQSEAEMIEAERATQSTQMDLFAQTPEEKPWTSTRSVSPKEARPNSSGR